MIIPSIDLMNNNAVQLIGGAEKALDAGDPRPIADKFGLVGEVAVIDLDAALGQGTNETVIRELVDRIPCRVGGGIRDIETATKWLDAGAHKVILGTAARPEILRDLPRDRVIAALDAKHGEVVTEGWTKKTGTGIEERIDALREYVGGFLITFVEHEGRMQGIPLAQVERMVHRAGSVKLTVAGGVRSPDDVAAVDRLGADVQVGMALYTGAFDIAEGFAAPLRSDRPDGLIPTVVTDSAGRTLGLTYSSLESLRIAIEERRGVYYSRSRDEIWRKGESSGNKQTLLGMKADCDRDALRFIVRQEGSFCHLGDDTCFGDHSGIGALDKIVRNRMSNAPAGSYTRRLFDDANLLESKLVEEARELAESETRQHAAAEAADLIYFATVAARKRGATLEDIETCLDKRSLAVTRRAGDAKSTEKTKELLK